MASLKSPPWVKVVGIENFRDLGGYAVSSSPSKYSIRKDFIFRCGEPSRVTEDGISTLRALSVSHIYDLRSKNEIENNKAAGMGGIVELNFCERVFAPVFLEKDYSPENLAIRFKDYASEGTEGFTRAYGDILQSAPSSYRQILLHLANQPDKPLIIHCTAGKDRTGVICALILSLCGVDDDTVAYEYSLTDIGLADFKATLIEHLMANPALNGSRKGAMNMISAKAANMLATLEMIRKNLGGPEGYMISKCGLSKEDIEKIRANLIVEAPPIHERPVMIEKGRV